MKVLVVATSSRTRGGITSVVKAHQNGAQWKDCNCKWIETHIDKTAAIKVLYFLKALLQFLFLLPSSDIVHIHLSSSVSAIRKSFFFFPARLLHKKIIIHFHAFSPESSITGRCAWLYRYIFRKSDIILVLSSYWASEVVKIIPAANVKVLFNPCPKIECKPYGKREKWILYAGTLNERKGYADLIKAFSMLNNKDWKLILLGNGEIDKARDLARSLGINDFLVIPGWVRGEEKEHYFKSASIFCLPSYAEGFPMAVLDAFAYNIPVITTPVGGIPDVAVNGENMLLFNPGDVNTLSDCLGKLIMDNNLRGKLSEQSEYLADNVFSQDVINEQLSEIYYSLVK